MANKTQPTAVAPSDFIAAVENQQLREDSEKLLELIQNLTGCKAKMWGPSMIGCDQYHYTYESGREGDLFIAGFAPRKSGPVIYLNGLIAEQSALLENLGPHRMGKGCLYIKRLSDVDMDVLTTLLASSISAIRKKWPTKGV